MLSAILYCPLLGQALNISTSYKIGCRWALNISFSSYFLQNRMQAGSNYIMNNKQEVKKDVGNYLFFLCADSGCECIQTRSGDWLCGSSCPRHTSSCTLQSACDWHRNSCLTVLFVYMLNYCRVVVL